MGNALKYLLQGFQGSYNRAAEDYQQEKRSNDIFNRQMDVYKAKQEEEQKALETQTTNDNSFIIPLLNGKRTQSPSEVQAPLRPQQVDLTPEERLDYESRLSQNGLGRLKTMEELNKPKLNQKLIGKRVFQTDEAGNIDFTKPPIYTEPEKPEKPSPRFISRYPDRKKNKWIAQHGIPITEDQLKQYPTNITINGQLFGITNETSEGNVYEKDNSNRKIMTPTTIKNFKDQLNWQLKLSDDYNDYQKRYDDGEKLSKDDRKAWLTTGQELKRKREENIASVKDAMSKSARDWYDGLWNIKGADPGERDYFVNLFKAYNKGDLGSSPNKIEKDDVADFQILKMYGMIRFGKDLDGRKKRGGW
jgi:hypothetical protein